MQLRQVWLVGVVLCAAAGSAHADGWLSMRGAYYKERATRVEQPMIDAHFETQQDGVVDAHVLVDSITSASTATGSVGAAPFTERRYEGGIGYTQKLGRAAIGASGKYSTESDYFSGFVLVHGELALANKNTIVGVAEGRGKDTITNGIATGMGGLGTPAIEKKLSSGLTSVSVVQIVSPTIVVDGTYDLIDAHGYQANVYRLVPGGSMPVPERVPELRLRNAFHVGVRKFIPETNTTVVLAYRFYFDDWGIMAHTPEARVSQQIVAGLDVRARYRLHVESKADFYKATYVQADIDDPNQFLTADDKLGPYHTQTFGVQLLAALSLFGVGGAWGDARIDAQADVITQTTHFGTAVEAHLALVVPFTY